MGSTRLPGKILKKINDKFVLDYVIERLRFCEKLDDIILATTTAKKDDSLEEYAIKKKINYFRGSEEDVLGRYYFAAKKYDGDIIVRITGDCPLIDPEIVDRVINKHIESKADYTSTVIKRTYPRGLDTEVFNFDTLEQAHRDAIEKYHREHVTPYIIEHPGKFKLQNVEAKGKIARPDIRITLDTEEDFESIKNILLHFDDLDFRTEDVIDFLKIKKEQKPWSYGDVEVIRKASVDDAGFIFDLRNTDYVRKVSWNTNPIDWDEHKKFWKDNYQFYWIIQSLSDNNPIGFIRVKNNEVSIALLEEYWNQSYGYFAMQEIRKKFPNLRAEVKLNNEHSLYFFVKCGFVPTGFILVEKIELGFKEK